MKRLRLRRIEADGYKLSYYTNGDIMATKNGKRYVAKTITELHLKIYGY